MKKMSLRDTFGDVLVEFGKSYKNMVVLDADLSLSTRTFKFGAKFPERFFNMGISEQNMVGTAIGLSLSGKIPIVSGFTLFTTGRAWEFVRLACYNNLNIKFITTHAGLVGEDGSTHNALEDLTLMASLTNQKVLVPSDRVELLSMLHYIIEDQGPCYIRLPRGSFPILHDDNYQFTLGKPDVIKDGFDYCFIGVGYGSYLCKEAALLLEREKGISIKVINLSSVKPINSTELIKEINDIHKILLVEEHSTYCGVGSIISRIISEQTPKIIKIIGVSESYGQSGTRELNLGEQGLTVEKLIEKFKSDFI